MTSEAVGSMILAAGLLSIPVIAILAWFPRVVGAAFRSVGYLLLATAGFMATGLVLALVWRATEWWLAIL